jgi:hypothetical protein
MSLSEADIRDYFYNAASTYGFIQVNKELFIGGLRLDLFAIDTEHNPYIVEFKRDKNRHIVGQSAHYLAMIPSFHKEISKKIRFHKINWDNLSVILVAPEYAKRDIEASKNKILKDKIHLYTYNPIFTTRSKIFGLNLAYLGPSSIGPLKLPKKARDGSDLIDLNKAFEDLDTRESKREYYTNHILPELQEINLKIEPFFTQHQLYFHTSYFGNNPPYYMIRYGTNIKQSHRASVILSFFQDAVVYGFDLTHSFEEGKHLSKLLLNENRISQITKKIHHAKDYDLYVPNTGFLWSIPITSLTHEALQIVLQRYNPLKNKDCYFRMTREHTEKTLTVDVAANILTEQYKEFKFMFDLIRYDSI